MCDHLPMPRHKGKVSFFNETKGFGFIEYPGAHDVYFDRAALVEDDTLPEGQLVTFVLDVNAAGEVCATAVRPDPNTRPNRRRGPFDRRSYDTVPVASR